MEVYLKEEDPFLDLKKTHEDYHEYSNGLVSYIEKEGPVGQPYIPISFSIEKKYINNTEEIQGIVEILPSLIGKNHKEKVKFIETVDSEGIITFKPLNEFDTYLYENPSYIKEIINSINIKELVGYTLLSSNPMARFVLEKWNKDKIYLLSDLKVKYVNDIAIIPLALYINQDSLFSRSKFEEIINTLNFEIVNYIKKGYICYSFNIFDLNDKDYVRNLCKLYEIEIVDESPNFLILRNLKNIDFKTSLYEWIQYNLPIIKSGNFPVFSISGNWQDDWTNTDFQRLNGTVFKKLVLKYIAIVAYSKLASFHPFTGPFIFLTDVNEDFSIRVSLPNFKMAEELKKYIEEEYKDINLLYIESCRDFLEGIVKRKFLQEKDPSSNSLLLKDSKGDDFLIFKSALVIQMPPVFPPLFKEVEKDMDTKKEVFRQQLIRHFSNSKLCHDDTEPVKLEKISDLSFEDLLFLIPVEENKVSYCFTMDTLSKIDKNPITRSPFSPSSIMKINYIEMGLRGFFDVNTLFGLLPDVPLKKNISVDGIVNMQRIKTEGLERELLGNLFLIKVLFKNGRETELMEICLPTVGLELIDESKDLSQKLWKAGYFLDYFNSAVALYIDKKDYKGINFVLTDPTFLNAGTSLVDGNMALEKMRNDFMFL